MARKSIPGGADRANQHDEAVTRKAIADAQKAEIQAAQLQRELDKKWIPSEEADLEKCIWTALTRDNISNRLIKALPAFIHAVGGHLDRLPEGQAVIDQAITDGCNDISNSDKIDVDVEEAE